MEETFYNEALSKGAALGAEDMEIYHIHETSEPYFWRSHGLVSVENLCSHRVGIRTLVQGKAGFASVNDPCRLDQALEAALEASRLAARHGASNSGSPSQESPLPQGGAQFCETINYDEKLITSDRADLIRLADRIGTRLTEGCPGPSWDVNIGKGSVGKRIISTRGVDAAHISTKFWVRITGTLAVPGEIFCAGDYLSTASFDMIDFPALIEGVIDRFRFARNLSTIQSGKMPILFTPGGAAALLNILSGFITPESLSNEANPLLSGLKRAIAPKWLEISDDPHLDWGVMTSPIDDEGFATNPTPIIQEGFFQGGIGNCSQVDPIRGRSTGNCFRDRDCRPRVGITTLVMEEGDLPFSTMVSSMDSGLVADSAIGLSSTPDGNFSMGLQTAYLVEKGEIVGRVRDVMISGSILDFLGTLEAAGCGARLCQDRFFAPPMLVTGLRVTTR